MQGLDARRLRLRLWFLWLRHSYGFRWAHRPLCPRFSAGILRIGHVHLCRSCICVYGGLAGGAALCLTVDALRDSAGAWLLAVMIPTVGLSAPRLYHPLPRPLRDLLRLGMGFCISLCGCAVLSGNRLVAMLCASVLILFWRRYRVQRRRRRADACNGCREYGTQSICTGCRAQAGAVRAYETEATRLLLASHRDFQVRG